MYLLKRGVVKKIIFLIFFSLSSLSLKAKAKTASPFFSDKIAVIVNDEVITENEVKQRVLLMKKMFNDQGKRMPEYRKMRSEVIEHLIIELLQKEQVTAFGLEVSDLEFEQIIHELAYQRGLTLEQFKQNFLENGIFWETFENYLKTEIANNRLRLHEFADKVSITSNEIHDFIIKNSLELDDTGRVYEIVKNRLFHEKMTKKAIDYFSELRTQSYVEYKIN